MLTRSNVHFSIQLPQLVYAPGDLVEGTLTVHVKKAVSLTAIRLQISGKEITAKMKYRGYHMRDKTVFDHFRYLVTYFGFSEGSGKRGGAAMDVGIYEYPISMRLPANIPPSVLVEHGSCRWSIYYKVKAFAVVPFGFDKVTELPIRIVSVVPLGQVEACRQVATGLGGSSDRQSVLYNNISVRPRIVTGQPYHASSAIPVASEVQSPRGECSVGLLGTNVGETPAPPTKEGVAPSETSCRGTAPSGPPSPLVPRLPVEHNVVLVHVDIRNLTNEYVSSIRVELFQKYEVHLRNSSRRWTTLITTGHASLPGGGLPPQAVTSVEVPLAIQPMAMLPVISTSSAEATTVLHISCPNADRRKETFVSSPGCILYADAATSAPAPPLPVSYRCFVVMPEERFGGALDR